MASAIGLMDLVAALNGTGVALTITATRDGGSSNEGNERGNDGKLGEHFWVRSVSIKNVGCCK